MAAKHFSFVANKKPKGAEVEAETVASEIPDLNNTLAISEECEWQYPKLLIAIASTRGLGIFNVTSGESEFYIRFRGKILTTLHTTDEYDVCNCCNILRFF